MEERVLDMPMRKVHALEILKGEKVREYRAFTDHWARRLCTFGNPGDKNLATGIREYDRVHFHPVNDKWFLDCEVKAIILADVNDEFLEAFGSEIEAEKGAQVFVIRLGGIIDTNLTES
ncbi:MAG: hypothetical protein IJ762_11825 [Bacteroidaceae bacterium]|nr:hypothetical protein [Bacteroidaceae bacterium]